MGFDREALIAACARHGRVARVVVAAVRGSAPREAGTAMLIWQGGQDGTIGGGRLEHELTGRARAQLAAGGSERVFGRHALGPEMGQCCGGSVDMLTEVYDSESAAALPEDIVARGPGEMPLAVRRLLAEARNGKSLPEARYLNGWMVEPVSRNKMSVWIWGAGHVGRALVNVLAPLPDMTLTWVDTHPDRFPETIPEGVTALPAAEPARLIPHAPRDAAHLIVTYSHALDLALCDGLLRHGARFTGLIGSATKWARFRKRLAAMGHPAERIGTITCPIGDPGLGKHPQQIALGVAAQLLHLGAQPVQIAPEENTA